MWKLRYPPFGFILLSDTAITRLPDTAYAALRDAFGAATVGLPRAPEVSIFDTCYNLLGYQSVRCADDVVLLHQRHDTDASHQNFLILVDDMVMFCFAFAPSSSGLSIMGNIQQEGIQITFDAANGFIGFGPNTCQVLL